MSPEVVGVNVGAVSASFSLLVCVVRAVGMAGVAVTGSSATVGRRDRCVTVGCRDRRPR